MTRIRDLEIPTNFVRMDDRMTDDDQFVNVYDRQLWMKNFNKTIAERARHPLISQMYAPDADTGIEFLPVSSLVSSSNRYGQEFFNTRLKLSRVTKELTIRIRAKTSFATGDISIYPTVATQAPSDDYKITVTGNTVANYSVDVPVNQYAFRYGAGFRLGLSYASDNIGSSVPGAPVGVFDAGPNYVTGNSEPSVGHIITINGAETTARQVIDVQTITVDAATYYKIIVNAPWSEIPSDESDTYNYYIPLRLRLHAMSIWEKPVTSFAQELAVV